jgi:TRAP transporter TAXI family solute receptor
LTLCDIRRYSNHHHKNDDRAEFQDSQVAGDSNEGDIHMNHQRSRAARAVCVLATLSFAVAACGGDDDEPAAEEPAAEPTEEPAAEEPTAEEPAAEPTEEPTAEEPTAEEPAAEPAEEPTAEEPAAEPAEEPAELEDLNLTMGGSQSSSSVFAFITAHARLMGDADGAMSINIRETGASVENIQLVEDGDADFGLTGLSTLIQAQRGIGPFDGSAYPDQCNLLNYLVNAEMFIVNEDIESIYDLDGKAFAPSFQGSALYDNVLNYFRILGIEVDVFDGSLEDIVNAMKDGRIVGFAKSANGFGPDSSMLDVASAVPVHVIGFTQEEADQILADDPVNPALYTFTTLPAGSAFDNEELVTSVVVASYFAKQSLPEDVQYRITKSAWEAIDEAAQQTNYAGAMGRTVDETTSTAAEMPLCPGAQRYYDELG